MIALDRILTIVILVWSALYTVSYGRWTWKKKNKLGAVMLFLLAAAVIVMPVYSIFFRVR